MPTEFEIIYEEFSEELDALSELSISPTTSPNRARARVAAANAATLLLAALFEEFIRQEVKAAFREKARRATNISDFPEKLTANVWRRSLEKLARTPLEEIEAGDVNLDSRIQSIVSFCIGKNVSAEVSDSVAHNDGNMRHSQLNALFKGIGLSNFSRQTCKLKELVDFLGCDNGNKASAELHARLDGFFRRRNEIAHAITIGSSSGHENLLNDIDFFRIFCRSIYLSVERHFEDEVAQSRSRPKIRQPRPKKNEKNSSSTKIGK